VIGCRRRRRESRHRLARAAPAVVAVVLGAALAAVTGIAPAPAAPDQRRPTGTIRLIQQSAVVAPDGEFAAFFEVSGVPAGSDLAVDIHPRIDTADRLDDARSGTPRNSEATFPVIDLPGDPEASPVQTGFVIQLAGSDDPIPPGGWSKRLTEAGAYPVRVRLRGPDNATLRTIVTYLVRAPEPDDDVASSPVALVADLDPGPAPDDAEPGADAPLDTATVDAMTTLAETLTAHPGVAASISLEPATVRSLAPVAAEPGAEPANAPTTTAVGAGSGSDPAHDEAVRALRAALALPDHELLGAPFVVVDPAELVAFGLPDELARQEALGARDLATLVPAPATATWLVDRPLDAPTTDVLQALGVTNLLVPSRNLVDDDEPSPLQVLGAGPGPRVVAIDPTLTVGDHDDPLLAAHALVGQLVALATIESGGAQVARVGLPDTVDDVAELDAVLRLLATDNPFLRPVTASALFEDSTASPPRVALRAPSIGPAGSYPDDLRGARRLLEAYASMVPDRPDLVAEISQALSRTAAAALGPRVRADLVGRQVDELESRFDQVSIPASDRVTLGARDARFPLVITSTSPVPVRVVVDLTSASDRLTVVEPRIEVVLDSDRTVVPVQVQSRSPGDTPLRITVTTPDGQVLLSEGSYSVRSTAVSGVGIVLTIGAGLFLAIWWARHVIRGRRPRPRHAR
jgi:hypothetical protein